MGASGTSLHEGQASIVNKESPCRYLGAGGTGKDLLHLPILRDRPPS